MPAISHNDIANAIYQGGEGKKGADLSNFISDTVRFLAKNNLISKSEAILGALKNIVNEKTGVMEVNVWGKEKMSTHAKHEIKEVLKKRYGDKDFVFLEHIDETLLGGFKIKAGDDLIDLTLRNKINRLKDYLIRENE